MDLGWKIIVKLRPDSDLSYISQAFSSTVRDKITYAKTLSDDEIKNTIDIVLCSMTTFGYECMLLGKPIWYLDTHFRLLEDIEKNGYAHLITQKIARSFSAPTTIIPYLKPRYSIEDVKYVFSDISIKSTVGTLITKTLS